MHAYYHAKEKKKNKLKDKMRYKNNQQSTGGTQKPYI